MASVTIQSILLAAQQQGIGPGKSLQALQWYMNKARGTLATPEQMMREFDKEQFRTTSQLMVGRMYMFYYDPKHKATLPYYDKFPCIWMIEQYNDGFLGLNLHYLPYALRARLMDALLELENNAKYPVNKKLLISYQIVRAAVRHKLFKPCVKRYLNNHVRSKLVRVNYREWEVAAFLPVHSFEKARASEVWAAAR